MKKLITIILAAILLTSCAATSTLQYEQNRAKQQHFEYWY